MDIKEFKMYLRGDCSPEELKKFEDWLGSEESSEQLLHLINNIDKSELSKNKHLIEGKLWNKISDRLEVEEMISSISKEYKKQEKRLDKNRVPIRRNLMHKRKAKTSLILIILILVISASLLIVNNLGIYNSINETAQIELVEKSTEKGQKLTLHLSDGTHAILNSNSSISFPRYFDDDIREVNVKGEVFFDVAHNESKPFIVHAGDVNAKVLGTSFNFRYFPEKGCKRISLVTGKVQVNIESYTSSFEDNEFILGPGEEIRIEGTGGKVVKDLFDVERITSWKNGTLYFKYATLEEVVQSLENWYGVDVQLIGKPPYQWKLTAKFSNENLENVLLSLSHSQGIKYVIDGKNVEIKF